MVGLASVCVAWGSIPLLQNENMHCLTYLPLRLRLLVFLLTSRGGVQRAQHAAHHCRASPRAPAGVVGTIKLQRTKGEVGFCAHTCYTVQTKGVLLLLGQHPMGTGVRYSRVRLNFCLPASQPPAISPPHHPPTSRDLLSLFFPFCVFLGAGVGQETELTSVQYERALVAQSGSVGDFLQQNHRGRETRFDSNLALFCFSETGF